MPAARGASQPKSGGGGDPPIRLSDYPTLREQPVADAAVPRMELVEWADRYGVVAGISTRGRGFSLGLWGRGDVGHVMTRLAAVRAAGPPALPGVVRGHPHHQAALAAARQ